MRRFRTEILLSLALVLLTAGAYASVIRNGFVNYDDNDYVVENFPVNSGLSAPNIRWAFTTTHAANWHPLTWLSLQLDATISKALAKFRSDGGDFGAAPYHATSVLFHALNAVLLFWLLRNATGAVWRAAILAAFFALHPLRVESVAWVAERKDVLSGFFWLLTTLAYVSYTRRPGWARYLLVLILFALGLMSKPMVVTLPCTLLLLDYWPLNRIARFPDRLAPSSVASSPPMSVGRLVLEKLPFIALSGAASVITMYAQRAGGAVSQLDALPLHERALNSMNAYLGYLGTTLWPQGLTPFYPHPRGEILTGIAVRAGLLLLAISSLVIVLRRRRYLAVGWLWFLGTLVPVIGLVQVGSQSMADRYTYIPLIGIMIAVVWAVADLAARMPARWRVPSPVAVLMLPLGVLLALVYGSLLFGGWKGEQFHERFSMESLWALAAGVILSAALVVLARMGEGRVPIFTAFSALLLGICVGLTAVQTTHWRQSTWLWEWTLQNTDRKKNWVAHNNLGNSYLNAAHVGDAQLKMADKEFEDVLNINTRNAKAIHNRGLILFRQGRYPEAIAFFEEANEIDPKLAILLDNWGLALARQGKMDEAIDKYRQALNIDQYNAIAYARLGVALFWRGDREEAVKSLRRAVYLAPTQPDYHANLAWVLHATGEKQEARQEYDTAMRTPGWLKGAEDSAWRWATNPDQKRRDPHEAVRLAEQACQATEPDAHRLDVLAAAYARAERFDEAICTAHKALDCADSDQVGEIEERLARYKKRKPYEQQATSSTP
jgi:tetratricopeptide (TPR) repeat protein